MDFDLAKKVTYGRVSTTAFCGSSWFGFAVVWYVNPVYTKNQSLSLLHTQTLQMDKDVLENGRRERTAVSVLVSEQLNSDFGLC